MATPKRNRLKKSDARYEETRKKIQTTQILKRLTCHILSTKDDAGNVVELTSSQVRAAEILLNKSLPNLTATEISGEVETGFSQIMAEIYKKSDK